MPLAGGGWHGQAKLARVTDGLWSSADGQLQLKSKQYFDGTNPQSDEGAAV